MSTQGSILNDKKIVLGITGGIAAYKAADLASKLTAAGATVRTILTEAAQNLITPKTFEAVTAQPVFTSMWSGPGAFQIGHVQIADWADAVVVSPATANIIAKMAHGICDDLLSATLCVCWQKPILMAPAMNTRMWSNPVTQKNVAALKEMNVQTIGPATGRLACGDQGPGRMAEPADISAVLEELLK